MSKDTSIIPYGLYCYKVLSLDKETFRLKVENCPYFSSKEVNGVSLPYCTYLNKGSVPLSDDSITKEGLDKLHQAWGETGDSLNIPEEFDLFLLWDMCKECGENIGDEEEFPLDANEHIE